MTQLVLPGNLPLMNVKETGKYLQLSSVTIYRLLKQNDLPGIKIGNRWRFSKETLDKFLDYNISRKNDET